MGYQPVLTPFLQLLNPMPDFTLPLLGSCHSQTTVHEALAVLQPMFISALHPLPNSYLWRACVESGTFPLAPYS